MKRSEQWFGRAGWLAAAVAACVAWRSPGPVLPESTGHAAEEASAGECVTTGTLVSIDTQGRRQAYVLADDRMVEALAALRSAERRVAAAPKASTPEPVVLEPEPIQVSVEPSDLDPIIPLATPRETSTAPMDPDLPMLTRPQPS